MIDALFDLLGTFYQSGQLEQAEWIARSILEAIPDDIVSLQFLGLLYYRSARRSEAMQAFNAAHIDAPAAAPAAAADPDLRASAQCLRAASGHGSTLAGAWYDLGLVLFRLGHYGQALAALQAAIAARPDYPAAQTAVRRISGFSAHRRAHSKQQKTALAVANTLDSQPKS
ncbi:tetratricopeptide repeat protein [Candidatus Accumulibacter phosphatis]|jgi:tetratricopeptide (TPR) repeat protein|nr:tetratricopeptide repeat protein [Candidatus Accumulibacter phosphatis]